MRIWYECRACDHVEDPEDWPRVPFCPVCSLDRGDLVEMEVVRDEEDFEPPTVRNEVV